MNDAISAAPTMIREAIISDLPAVLSLYRNSGLDRKRSLTTEEAEMIFRKITTYPWYRIYLAEIDGIPVGTFALLIMDNLVNGGIPSGVVEDVAVASQFQRLGIGRTMMRFALEQCRRNGCYKMSLSSNRARVEAHKFYESLGFVRRGYSFRMEFGEDDAPSL